ncbi:MAG TPA: peptidoglycan DD-metalloendopeptidase family protein [Vicinamibacterales bacterium]
MTPTLLPGLPAGVSAAGQAENPARVRELAAEFEAMFLALMLRQMRESMALAGGEDDEPGLGRTPFAETFDVELGRHLAAGGGIGIASVIVEAYERQHGIAQPFTAPAPAAGAPVPPAAPTGVPAPAIPLPLADRITSPFGWRRDPLDGHGRQHRGVDIAAAHGDPIPAAADGRVVFAGPQGGYGLTVVVEHGSGIRTRYAHLSELHVAAGQEVRQGQEVGKAGATGRATGAHLHFEVLASGQAVDPVVAARRYAQAAGLKPVRTDADWSGAGPSPDPVLEE